MPSDSAETLPRTVTTGSEAQTLLAVSAAHLISHFYIMVLPVMLPLLKERLNVSFLDLGLALTTFNVVTGLTQAPTGFLVDRIGARPVLIAGLVLGGLSIFSIGFITSYQWLLLAAGHGRPCQLRLSPGRLRDPRRQHRRGQGRPRVLDPHLCRLPRRRRRARDSADACRLRRARGRAHVAGCIGLATALLVFLLPNQQPSIDRSRAGRSASRGPGEASPAC
jgi:hypothetical protein